ncbi:MAG: dimethyl sulfoxide reductase anchor subunit [Pseudorhodoplanes sp.]|nr:dimethyl sulfoxide reductase anchor subunit [Pseudorhodoplanes sp.]
MMMKHQMSGFELAGDSFRLGYRFQRYWDVSMASAFFCGELGAGLFIVAMVYDSIPGLVLGLLVAGVGKSLFHLTHMGVPGKSWRAILRPDRSWVSRGLIAIVVFCAAGILHTINVMMGRVFPYGTILPVIAAASGLVVMLYQGFAMADSPAIALWNTAMMPFAGLLYALTSGLVLTLVLHSPRMSPEAAGRLTELALIAIVGVLIMLLSVMHAAFRGSPGSRLSAKLLTQSRYAAWFYGVTIGVGVVVPLVALWLGNGSLLAGMIAAGGVLAGFYSFRVLVFKAGVYEPILPLKIA